MRAPLAIAVLLVAGLGCTAADADDAASTSMASRSGSMGILELERGAGDTPWVSSPRAVLSGVFARYEGIEGDEVLRLLGVGRGAPSLDGCALVGQDPDALPEPSAAVDLLDAGHIDVSVAGSEAQLTARTFPELGSLVAGTFYAEDAELAVATADVDEYRFVSSGSADLPAFDVSLVAPPALADLTVAGTPAADEPVLARGEPVVVAWESNDPRDRVDIRLASGAQVLECVARDDGLFRLPEALVSELDADEDARLVIRRVRTTRFDVAGLDTAWVDLAATETVVVAVR